MSKKTKYYVVWEGVKPGVYSSWPECQLQIQGYPNAKYKSFKTLDEATSAYRSAPSEHIGASNQNISKANKITAPTELIQGSIAVDAACSGNPGVMEYRGVVTATGEEIFRQGPFQEGTNNIGEFLAIVHALALLQKTNQEKVSIFTDSRTAMAWVRNRKVKTTLRKSPANTQLFALIDRALDWIHTHEYQNQIIKWDTKSWGEIPADFGRK